MRRNRSTNQFKRRGISRIKNGGFSLRHILLLGSALLFLVSSVLLVRYLIMTIQTRKTNQELKESYYAANSAEPVPINESNDLRNSLPHVSYSPVPVVTPYSVYNIAATQIPVIHQPQSTPEPAMLDQFVKLYKANKDIVGWLKSSAVPEIDFPITQRDNVFYLTHDFYGRTSASGTVFLDQDCSTMPRSENLILHGHNMKNGTMFGKLKSFLEETTFKKDPLISYTTLYQQEQYVPFAVSLVSVDPKDDDYLSLISPDFTDDEQRDDYISRLTAYSVYSLPVDVLLEDELLTLATCHGDEDSERLVIGLRKLRPYENADELVQNIRDKMLVR